MAKPGSKTIIQKMSLNKIKLSRNSRAAISRDELEGLMQSIKTVGLLQPIGVVKSATGGYEICYGNRRYLACSKLGMSTIPVIIHSNKKEHEIDLKNLTENIQRRNISLAEAGRYIDLLNKDGLSLREIAVRLGVSASYVESCRKCFVNVPKEFRDDLEIQTSNHKVAPGKIAMKSATKILSAVRTYRLDPEEAKSLFQAAKTDPRFTAENIEKYAASAKRGSKDPIGSVNPTKHVRCNLLFDEKDYNDLMVKYVNDGPFRSIPALLIAVLRGEKDIKIKIVGTF